MKRTALVLVSGGMDSAAALWWARERYPRIATLCFRTPATPPAERRAAGRLSRAAGASAHHLVELPFLVGGLSGRPQGYLPRRNLVFYAAAASVAEREGASVIVGGHLGTDGAEFYDARPAYFRRLAALAGARIILPFLRKTKSDVVSYGRRRGVPFEWTWSCYHPGAKPCGRCVSCRERARALEPKERP